MVTTVTFNDEYATILDERITLQSVVLVSGYYNSSYNIMRIKHTIQIMNSIDGTGGKSGYYIYGRIQDGSIIPNGTTQTLAILIIYA